MPTQIIAGDNQNEASFVGANDGAIKLRVGPAGSKADGISISSSGNVDVLGALTQGAGISVPRMQLGTAQATTSGTSIDFTSVPSWANRITVIMRGISLNGTSYPQLQIGSGSIQTTGYLCSGFFAGASNAVTGITSTSGFVTGAPSATNTTSGQIILTKLTGNTWVATTQAGITNTNYGAVSGGDVTLSGTLDRLRLTTVNGTDTFDAGSINVLYEGYV